jgi:hypothetical protein
MYMKIVALLLFIMFNIFRVEYGAYVSTSSISSRRIELLRHPYQECILTVIL